MDKKGEDNRANQRNPNNDAYYKSRNAEKPKDWKAQSSSGSSSMSKQEQDNRSRQMNPNNQAYYDSRAKGSGWKK